MDFKQIGNGFHSLRLCVFRALALELIVARFNAEPPRLKDAKEEFSFVRRRNRSDMALFDHLRLPRQYFLYAAI
jgi:hypothetical protein